MEAERLLDCANAVAESEQLENLAPRQDAHAMPARS
jgi:hypothetical protein